MIHFGNNKKYLEYEIYTILMLKKNTKNDIIYLYSINDTPQEYVDLIKLMDVRTKSYDDNKITFNIDKFKSSYNHFNTLRTCNYLFAYQLIEYEKICIIESDMIFMKNLDDIFKLKCPTISYYLNQDKLHDNYKITESNIKLFNLSINNGVVNGGVIIFKPSIKSYNDSIIKLKDVIDNNCIYPNESLFLYTSKTLYNLPIKYNMSHYYINKFKDIYNDICIFHFNATIYKPLDIIKDNYVNKQKNKLIKQIVIYFKNKYYDKYYDKIDKIIKKVV